MLTMEAYEEKDVKRDSFEEVDRILAIVEESKKKSDKEDTIYNLVLTGFYIVMTGVLGAAMIYLFYEEKNSNKISSFFAPVLILFLWAVYQIASINKTKRKIKLEFEQTRDQATEVIREIVPALSRSERWSALRKFELRLRLSKLGISTGQILGHEFDLP